MLPTYRYLTEMHTFLSEDLPLDRTSENPSSLDMR